MTATETLQAYLAARGLVLDPDYQRDALRVLVQALMESEVRQILAAAPYERNDSRRAYRNGYRASPWPTALGDLNIQIPKLRKGSYYPAFLKAEAWLRSTVADAYVAELTPDDLRNALAPLQLLSLAAQDWSDIAERLSDAVYNAKHRPVEADYALVLADLVEVEDQGWRQMALLLGIRSNGDVDLLAHEIASEVDDHLWRKLLRELRRRGLESIEAVISRDFPGLRTAVETVYADAVWRHQDHVLLRAEGDPVLVDAVSRIVLGDESGYANGPQMQLLVNLSYVPTFWPVQVWA